MTRGSTGRGTALLAVTALLAGGTVALAPGASADHSVVELVSTGPADDGGGGTDQDDDDERDVFAREVGGTTLVSFDPTDTATGTSTSNARFQGASADAQVVVFEIGDQLSDDDTDPEYDAYVRSGDDVSLVTGVPGTVSTELAYQLFDTSTDGSRVLFVTNETLLDADNDLEWDLYLYDGGALRLVTADTVEPVFIPEAWNPTLGAVTFRTGDALVPEDTDTDFDLYLYRVGGPPALVTSTTTGEILSLSGVFVSVDGSHVVFESLTPLTPGEGDDGASDLYLWSAGGQLRLLAGGTDEEDAVFLAASTEAARVIFQTVEPLLPSDTDARRDIYEATAAAISQVSSGVADEGVVYRRSSVDAAHVFWQTAEPVLGAGHRLGRRRLRLAHRGTEEPHAADHQRQAGLGPDVDLSPGDVDGRGVVHLPVEP